MAKKRTTSPEPGAQAGAAPTRRRTVRRSAEKHAPAETVAAPMGNGVAVAPDREEIARLAYSYWVARGQQGGSPEDDWYRAEQELKARYSASAA